MNAVLSPLRLSGVRVVNYLDDWLLMAPLAKQLCSHRHRLIKLLQCLGLTINLQKSQLQLMQCIHFWA